MSLGFGLMTCGMVLSFFCLVPKIRVLAMDPSGGLSAGNREEAMADALEACEDASVGDECSLSINDEDVSGICKTGPAGDNELMCLPEGVVGGRAPGKGRGGAQDLNQKHPEEIKTAQKKIAGNVEQRMLQQKANAAKIISMVEKIIIYIESQEIDATEIRNQLEIFKAKKDELTNAYTAYSELEEENDVDDLKTARENIITLAKSTKAYFQETLKVTIQETLSEIN